ncbi:LOG family protein [Tuwongella immobilis]|uniref:Cytokinin riboside 5'-monophosphate phosphoribohydrolase n=1 Tax=Tuwongella immobilis TaxID=692036 RepID=A0A6C2YJC1_9BACT|nr:TIGR00730 family Rossman fold protein [Tuwongella immobilis]VIP01658.1 Uncharacterized protein OS=Geobacter lovleyi (strain ATCC BAA-1151 / DSM 17278 / SZ) GN=Glov_0084 PE=4 SV=1: Lysine_decarbox [Tuwongella immobilis]VTR99062.1 Uncharacterized protein OS=Geobacter lovleyi (strain ATCC BAA-1151 / DSM 17278 / SZ) GN=Glov_0084 PE=4 SV=1: Lysine_decarbox [Tuwongella immobilis]
MKRICVFCGSKSGNRPVYAEMAQRLGETLAARQLELVYGGGAIGLMGVVARATLSAGGRVTGIMPRRLAEKEVLLTEATENIIVETMHQRKAMMADRSDGFIAMPGGYGTCEEFFEILTWSQLGIHTKPMALLNTAGFFDPLLAWIDGMVHEGFLRPRFRELLIVGTDPEDTLARMERYFPPLPPDQLLNEIQR